MPTEIYQQRNFSGGENLRLLPEFVGEDQVVRAKNLVVTDGGHLETRLGKVKINTTSFGAAPVLGVWRYVKEDGSKFLVVQHNTSLWAAAWDGESTISSFTEVKTGLSAVKLSGYVWKDNLILGNGTNDPFRFNGVSCANLGGTPPKFKVFTVYAGRLWVVDADNPSLIFYSGLEDYDSWNALDVIKVRDQDGDRIRGLQPVSGGLSILKDTSIWSFYGTSADNFRLSTTPIDDTVGCVSNEGSLPQGVCFSGDNIQLFDLQAVNAVADTHTAIFNTLTDTEKRAVIVGVQPNIKRGIVYIPAKDTAIVLDGRHNAITTWEGLNANCFAVADGEGDDGRLILGDATAGFVYMLSGSDDDGTAINNHIKFGYKDHGVNEDKIWRKFEPDLAVIGSGTYSMKVTCDLDYKRIEKSKYVSGSALVNPAWSSDWETIFWGNRRDIETPSIWLSNARGDKASFEIELDGRIRFFGYKTRVMNVGEKR